jgi:hypothetical protein
MNMKLVLDHWEAFMKMRIDFQRVIVHENHISHKINTCSVKIQTCWLTGVPNLECSQTYSLTQKYCSLKLSSINIIPSRKTGPIGIVHHLQKTMSGGIMLMELSFREQYFCVKLYVCEHSRLGTPVNQHVCIFKTF